MTTLTKADLAKYLDEAIGLTNREAKEIVELFFQYISDALVSGLQVKISGFGNFTLHDKKERPGRNPRTGEEVPVTARRVVTFHTGQKLKARVESFVGGKVKEDGAGEKGEA
jgi:integration host factor subunit alpha